MSEELEGFIKKWNNIVRSYYQTNNFRSSFEEDLFFSGEFYSPASEEHQLIDNALPEPYLGDPYNSGYVCLNLNPGRFIESVQHPINGKFNKEGNALDSYSEFVKEFPYLTKKYKTPLVSSRDNDGHKWWKRRHTYYKRLLNDPTLQKPFALEICPWRSSRFGNLRRTTTFYQYFIRNILDIASLAAMNSKNKIVFSVGSVYHYMFQKLSETKRLSQINYVSHDHQQNFCFPVKPNGKTVQRHLSVWKDEEFNTIYFNTYAPGSNKPPSPEFDKIIITMLKNTDNRR